MMFGMQESWIVMVLALALDRFLGEPSVRWHPVVWMGASLDAMQRWVFKAHAQRALFWRGASGWLVLAMAWVGCAWLVQWGLAQLHWGVACLLTAVLLKPMFAWRMLRGEALAVEHALRQSLVQGQQQLARLVSRDVHRLQPAQVRESAIESLAENFNDSVFAPLFWFVLLGLPGAVLYRFANTADAMWGYPGWRAGRDWQWAGKWAARADDVLSYLPARLTALALLVANGCVIQKSGVGWRHVLERLIQNARQTPSPNSGWPMSAMALLLDVRLSKPGVYVLHPDGASPGPHSLEAAARMARRALHLACWGLGLLVSLPFWTFWLTKSL